MTVQKRLAEVALKMNETSSEEEFMLTSSKGEGEEEEMLGAYYVYDMDETSNNYSIAVYGRQSAPGAIPTYGATMLETLARKITNKDIEISFNNR